MPRNMLDRLMASAREAPQDEPSWFDRFVTILNSPVRPPVVEDRSPRDRAPHIGFWDSVAQGVGRSAREMFTTPGEAVEGRFRHKPTVPGQWSDADEAMQQIYDNMLAQRGIESALNMVGAPGLTGGVPGLGSGVSKGIRAYHGSPHDFDRFDFSKIGTGEGAQAYGHGGYFAESEGVAREYRRQLASGPHQYIGPEFTESQLLERAAKATSPADRESLEWLAHLVKGGYSMEKAAAAIGPEAATKLFGETAVKPPGHMYEVNIKADPAQFLDWDAPLSAQPQIYEKVKNIPEFQTKQAIIGSDRIYDLAKAHGITGLPAIRLQRLLGEGHTMESAFKTMRETNGAPAWLEAVDKLEKIIPSNEFTITGMVPETWPGSAIARGVKGFGSQEAAKTLRDAGIPAIKYLDQGSRAAGEGSRNYVVFDDALVDIVRKYGIGGLSMLPPAAAAYLSHKVKPVDYDPFGAPVEHDPFKT